ncbi:MAG TPA: helix-turn-helix domain-containing protein [Pseudomonadota bacterium]|jgi:AcrR family transcriptional regulator|nr:helix-turn-helix domain-containing protein [Pseudomonadota bacterium]HND09430.1 helix-turn-helix domain-containing protein [Pseudomonadota bacterium]HNK43701.1 helix-turn-helix domain-containing protein [Pseudomonadota bacterium]
MDRSPSRRKAGAQVADAAVRKPTTSRAAKRPQRARLLVDERRAQLLALGIKLFAERSYDEVSIDELARAANISKGLLYHYFPTKRDLYTAALRQAAQQLLDETQPLACLPQDERARRGLETYLAFADRHGPAYVALMRGGLGADREIVGILEATRGTIAQRILDALPTGIATPLIRAAVRGWIGFVEATALDWLAHKQVDRDRLVELLLGLLFDAIARAAVAG